jgi:hypothetical protein
MSDNSGRSTRNRGPPPLEVPHVLPTATRRRRPPWFPNFTFAGTPTLSSSRSAFRPSSSYSVPPEDSVPPQNPIVVTPNKPVVPPT